MRNDVDIPVSKIATSNAPIDDNKIDNTATDYQPEIQLAGVGKEVLMKALDAWKKYGPPAFNADDFRKNQAKEMNYDELPESQKKLIETQKKLDKTPKKAIYDDLLKKKHKLGFDILFQDRATKKAWRLSGLDPSKYTPTGQNRKGQLLFTLDDLERSKKESALNPDPEEVIRKPDEFFNVSGTTKLEQDDFLGSTTSDVLNFQLDVQNIKSADDAAQAIELIAENLKDKIDISRRGKLPDELADDLAKELRVQPMLINRELGGAFNVEKILAARYLLVQSKKYIKKLGRDIINLPKNEKRSLFTTPATSKMLLDFVQAFDNHGALASQLLGVRAEAGRATRAFGIGIDDATGLADPRQIETLLNDLGGTNNVYELVEKVMGMADDAMTDLSRTSNYIGTSFFRDGWGTYYQSSLMWSPATTQRNFYGTSLLTATRPLDTFFAGTVGKTTDKYFFTPLFGSKASDKVYAGEALFEFFELIYSIPEALKNGSKSAFYYEPRYQKMFPSAATDTDRLASNTWTKVNPEKSFKDSPVSYGLEYSFKNTYSVPFRGAFFGDEANKITIHRMENARLAYRQAQQAVENGATVEDAIDGMIHQIQTPDPDLLKRIIDQVNEGTLVLPLSKWGTEFQNLLRKGGPAGKLIVPFFKTLANIEQRIQERLPSSLVVAALPRSEDLPVYNRIAKDFKAGGAKRQMLLGRMTTGGSLLGLGYFLAQKGLMTGSLSGSDTQGSMTNKELRELGGMTPNSIVDFQIQKDASGNELKDEEGNPLYKRVYSNISGLDPVGYILTLGATLYELGEYNDGEDEDYNNMLMDMFVLSYSKLTELNWASGFQDWWNFIETSFANQSDPSEQNQEQYDRAKNKLMSNYGRQFLAGNPLTILPMPGVPFMNQLGIYNDPKQVNINPDPRLSGIEQTLLYSWRKWTSKIPIFNKDLNPKRNVFGEPISYGKPNMWNFVFPFWQSEENLNTVNKKIVELNRKTNGQVLGMPEQNMLGIKLTDDEFSDMLYIMNNIKLNNRTYKETIYSVLNNKDNKILLDAGKYDDVVKKLRNTTRTFKEAVFFDLNQQGVNEFREKYSDTWHQINYNKTRLQGTGKMKRKKIPTEDVSYTGEVLKDIKKAVK
jgi:hypothetical protein